MQKTKTMSNNDPIKRGSWSLVPGKVTVLAVIVSYKKPIVLLIDKSCKRSREKKKST